MRAIAVLLFAVIGVLSFQGCSSEEGPKPENKLQGCPNSPSTCPSMGSGVPCCSMDKCGLDTGFGCIVMTSDAGA